LKRWNIILFEKNERYLTYLNSQAGKMMRYTGIPVGLTEISFVFSDYSMGGGIYHLHFALYRVIPGLILFAAGLVALKGWGSKYYSRIWALCQLVILAGQAISITIFLEPAPVAFGFTIGLVTTSFFIYFPLKWYFIILLQSGALCFYFLFNFSLTQPAQGEPLMIMMGSTFFITPFIGLMLWNQRYYLWLQKQITDRQTLELQRYASQINKELLLAARIQRSLLPAPVGKEGSLFLDYRYIPAGHLAGDMIHIISLGQDKTLVIMTDVSGHGVAASLYSMLLQIETLHTPQELFLNPGLLLAHLNESLYPGVEGHFVTAVVCIANTLTQTIQLATAGHHDSVIINPETRTIRKIKSSGRPLGILPRQKYPVISEPISNNEILFIYSDGCFEMEQAQEFQEEDFLELVMKSTEKKEPKNSLDFLLQKMKGLLKGEPFSDDVTIVLLKLQP